MTLPNAATQLVSQVQAHSPDATYETTDEPDGFGVNRTIEFDADTTKWLKPIMDVLVEHDERVAEVGTKAKKLRVTFVPDIRADYRDPYEIEAVEEVFTEDA